MDDNDSKNLTFVGELMAQTDHDHCNPVDKVRELISPRYYVDDPQKRYLPNIVLIDDDQDILVTFQSFLSNEGFNVQTFSKPNEALEYLSSGPQECRVVITDIRMPGVNGLEIYQKVKSMNKNTKVIFVSALDATEELLSIFSDVKESDIIRKPMERDQFVMAVKVAIFGCISIFAHESMLEILSQFMTGIAPVL